MHAIPGSTRESRCRPDTHVSVARVNFRKYRFIGQNPIYFQSRTQESLTLCDLSRELKNLANRVS